MDTQNNSGRKRILLFSGLVLVVVMAFVLDSLHHGQPQKSDNSQSEQQQADVTLDFKDQTDSQGVAVTFNNNALAPKTVGDTQWTYALSPGTYALVISKAGYKQLLENFTASVGQTTFVNVSLQPTFTSNPIANTSQIAADSSGSTSLAGLISPASTITKTAYFDNNTWAVLTINTRIGLGLAYVVAQYDPSGSRWVIVYGPSDDFEVSALQQMPSDLQSYVDSNFYVEDGGT